MAALGTLEFLKLSIYFASYLYFIAAPFAIWIGWRSSGAVRIGSFVFFLAITILAYARFIEPRILLTKEHDVELAACFDDAGAVRIAIFSDTHNGLFGHAMPIERIAARVQATKPDFVLIAGDFVYFLDPARFDQTFHAFSAISAPVFAVLGNHDLGLPGPDLRAPLKDALPQAGVQLIDDRAFKLSNRQFRLELVGLSDQWDQQQKLSLLEQPASMPRLVLTHNPATVRDFTPGMSADLLVGGHTHGGQIQLPFLTCLMTGICGENAYGLRTEKNVQIFTTSGTGMVGLPMRFRVPPRIDVLNLRYKKCAAG